MTNKISPAQMIKRVLTVAQMLVTVVPAPTPPRPTPRPSAKKHKTDNLM